MKHFSFFITIFLLLLFAACGTTAKFPVSLVTPAAEIKAHKKQNKNGNYEIRLRARNLAEANRLSPPMSTYVVWALTEDGNTQNIGQLDPKNAQKVTFRTSTPFNVFVLFITAEDADNRQFPRGQEIARTRFRR